jgi:hypothetical protein
MADQADRPPRPGVPGKIGGRRVRARQQLREYRAANKPAVARLAEREIQIKERIAEARLRLERRLARTAIVLRVLVAAAITGVVVWRVAW